MISVVVAIVIAGLVVGWLMWESVSRTLTGPDWGLAVFVEERCACDFARGELCDDHEHIVEIEYDARAVRREDR